MSTDKARVYNLYLQRDIFFRLIVGVIVYFAVAKGSLLLATINNNTSPFWPPTGLAIAAVLMMGKPGFFVIFVGALLANLSVNSPLSAATSIAIGNGLEGLLGAWIMTTLAKRKLFDEYTEPLSIFFAAPIAAIVSAVIGGVALYCAQVIPGSAVVPTCTTWWIGDVIGGVVVFPLINAIYLKKQTYKWHHLTLPVALVLFHQFIVMNSPNHLILLFVAFPLLLVASVGGDLAVLTYTTLFAIVAAVFVRSDHGLFHSESTNSNLINLQIFVCALQISALFICELRLHLPMKRLAPQLFLGWLLTGLLFHQFNRSALQKSESEFHNLADQARDAVIDQFSNNLALLKSSAAMFVSHDGDVSSAQWRKYFNAIDFDLLVGGVHGLGVVYFVGKDQIASFEKQQKQLGNDCFKYHWVPNGFQPKENSYIITLIEPLDRNKAACGLDLASESNRKEAAELSYQQSRMEMTGTIQLVQDSKPRAGFLLYYPIDRTPEVATKPALSAKIYRKPVPIWIYSPVVVEELLVAALNHPQFQQLTYSFVNDTDNQTLFSIDQKEPKSNSRFTERIIEIGSKKLKLVLRPTKMFPTYEDSLPVWIALAGSVITLLLTALFASLQSVNLRATAMAERKTAELERANENLGIERAKAAHTAKLASLGEMSAGVAHEINNPLAIIAGSLPLLVKHRMDSDKFAARLNVISRSVERIEKIVKGLKKFARTSSGNDFQVESLEAMISEALILTEAKSKKYSVPIHLDIKPPLYIDCDVVEIEQVVVNLINNGIDAVKTAEDRWLKISAFAHDDMVVLRVADSGPGISLEVEQKMFSPFFTTKPVGEGTGLGLSIAKGILDNHKASFALNRSFPNTCFEICFPNAQAKPDRKSAA